MTRASVKYYLVAVSIVASIALAKAPIESAVGPGPPLILFVPAVTLAAWLGGLGPGLLAAALSSLICCYFYFPPIGSFQVGSPNDRFRLALFWVQGIMTSVLIERLHAARRQAEENTRRAEDFRDRLAQTEGMLRSLMDSATAVIYIKDAEGRYLLVNRPFEAGFGGRGRPVVGSTDLELFPREFAEKYRADDRLVLATGRGLECEEIAVQEDGLHTYSTVKFPIRDRARACYAVGGFSFDITEQKDALERLRKREAEFRVLADAIPQLVWVTTPDDAIVSPCTDQAIEASSEAALYKLAVRHESRRFVLSTTPRDGDSPVS